MNKQVSLELGFGEYLLVASNATVTSGFSPYQRKKLLSAKVAVMTW